MQEIAQQNWNGHSSVHKKEENKFITERDVWIHVHVCWKSSAYVH